MMREAHAEMVRLAQMAWRRRVAAHRPDWRDFGGVFGMCEMECAAAVIVNTPGWRGRTWTEDEFGPHEPCESTERGGFWWLCAYGWIVGGQVTQGFIDRVAPVLARVGK
jgi:hypothetical protein